ncbi:MAG: type III PLP-dependent enzyme [Chitinivibrionales bacterium]|nr:type III PLP-dependent enzyme [Chitinivibrionales bacterium]
MNYQRSKKLALQWGTPVLLLSLRQLQRNYHQLAAALPGVGLYYALKANPAVELVRTLSAAGCCFDVSSNGEIDITRNCGIEPARCIHTHPVKTDASIRYALDYGIDTFVVDNIDEARKMIPYAKRASLLVRMSIQNPACVVNLSHKFGVAPAKTFALIEEITRCGLHIRGISFHIGSQSDNSLKMIEALEYCRDIYRMAALRNIDFDLLDIGGGFPITYLSTVQPIGQFCRPVNEYLERFFGMYRVIAEPGRYLCGPALTLATTVTGKSLRNGVWWYYLDEGIYGTFSGKIYDHVDYEMQHGRTGTKHLSTLAGPTCDSFDVIYENIELPLLEIGDILTFHNVGAYTSASASTFNGFEKARIVPVTRLP